MKKPEGLFKDSAIRQLESLKTSGVMIAWYCPHDDQGGIPDIIGCVEGRAFYIELKVETRIRPDQRLFLVRMAEAGALSYFATQESKSVLITEAWGRTMRLNHNHWMRLLLTPSVALTEAVSHAD